MQNKRAQHYVFAHVAMPQIFYADPGTFMNFLARDRELFVRYYWDKVGEKMENPDDRVDPAGLAGEVRFLDHNIQAGVITLPLPQATTEAYFVAAIFRPSEHGDPLAHYYTLELGHNFMTNEPYTVLCHWSAERAHGNMGPGPEPQIDAFLAAVEQTLDA